MMRASFYWLPLALLLAACSLKPVDTGRGHMLVLDAVDTENEPRKPRYGGLVVELPSAPAELDTYRIALHGAQGSLDYYAGARWGEFLPSLLQDRLLRSLTASGLFAQTALDTTANNNALVLQTDITDFQAEYRRDGQPPMVQLAASFRLTDRITGRALKQWKLQAREQAKADSLDGVGLAFRGAFSDLQRQLMQKLAQ